VRFDVGVGTAIGLLALAFGPGLGIVALLALVAIAGCAASLLIDRRRARAARPRSRVSRRGEVVGRDPRRS
jgi:hypothetical protein